MATGTGNTLQELERSWFATQVGSANDQLTTNELKRQFYISQIGGTSANVNYLADLEKQWLRFLIDANGETPSDTNHVETLWREVVVSEGLTPSNYVNDNKQIFYRNVA